MGKVFHMKQEQFEQDLLQFINEQILGGSNKKINNETLLFEDRLIDSLKILDLIAFVEKKLKMKIPDNKIVMENFASIERISKTFYKASNK